MKLKEVKFHEAGEAYEAGKKAYWQAPGEKPQLWFYARIWEMLNDDNKFYVEDLEADDLNTRK